MKKKPTAGLEENEVNWGDFEKGKVLSEKLKAKENHGKISQNGRLPDGNLGIEVREKKAIRFKNKKGKKRIT